MNKTKKKMKKKNVYFIIGIISGLLLGFVITFLALNGLNKDGDEKPFINEKKSEGDVFVTKSLYCDIYYPTKWEEKVLIEESLNVVHFSANMGEEKVIDLFDIVASENEDGKVEEVHIIVHELNFDEQWSDEEKTTVTEMQEDVNCIVDYLEKDDINVAM